MQHVGPGELSTVNSQTNTEEEAKDKIEKKDLEQVIGAITALDIALIGPNGVEFDNEKLIIFKGAQAPIHFVLTVKNFMDMFREECQNNLRKKFLEMMVHFILTGLSAYQLYLHIILEKEHYTCNSKENYFIPSSNGTYIKSSDPIENNLCFPTKIVFGCRIGFILFAAAMRIVKVKKSSFSALGMDGGTFRMQTRQAREAEENASNHEERENQNEPIHDTPMPLESTVIRQYEPRNKLENMAGSVVNIPAESNQNDDREMGAVSTDHNNSDDKHVHFNGKDHKKSNSR